MIYGRIELPVKYAISDIWPQGIGGEINLSLMAMFEVWTRGIKPTSGQLLIASNDLGSQESRLNMGISPITTSDIWPQIIVRDIGLGTMVIGSVCLLGLDLVISQLSIATKDP